MDTLRFYEVESRLTRETSWLNTSAYYGNNIVMLFRCYITDWKLYSCSNNNNEQVIISLLEGRFSQSMRVF